MSNMRSNIMLTFYGKTRSVTEWSKISLVPRHAIYTRLKRGWSPQLAVWTQPAVKTMK